MKNRLKSIRYAGTLKILSNFLFVLERNYVYLNDSFWGCINLILLQYHEKNQQHAQKSKTV